MLIKSLKQVSVLIKNTTKTALTQNQQKISKKKLSEKCKKMNRSIVYHTEDLNSLSENIPEQHKIPVTKMMFDMMNHEAYNNGR